LAQSDGIQEVGGAILLIYSIEVLKSIGFSFLLFESRTIITHVYQFSS